MTPQKEKVYRSREEEVAIKYSDKWRSTANLSVYDAINSALEEYATQEKDRQDGWTDEQHNAAISKAVEQAYQEGFYAGQGLK